MGLKKEQKIAKVPKKKPEWMPHHFWGYLKTAKNPHKRPSDVNRRKWKLYLKFKKKGYNAELEDFSDDLFDDELLDDEQAMDQLLDEYGEYAYDDEHELGYY